MSAENEPAASPALVCPGCGKPIDALRAGHVAILDGVFRYFCDRSCKLDYLERSSRAPGEAVTVRPPPVASSERGAVAVEVRVEPVAVGAQLPEGPTQADPETPASGLRLPPSSKSVPDRNAREWLASAPYVGLVSGFLAFSVGLAGERVARLRLGFALIAGAILVAALWHRRRGSHAISFVVRGFPTVVACLVATAATIMRLPSANDIASFCGLAAFVTLLVHAVGERMESDMEAQATRVAELLVSDERGEPLSEGAVESFSWLENDGTRRALLGHAARLLSDTDTRVDVHAPIVRGLKANLERASIGAFAVVLGAALFVHVSLADSLASACAGALAVSLSGTFIAVRMGVHAPVLRALRRGVFYRDANAFDSAGKTDVAVICARGTVLLGEPEIISVESLAAGSADRVLALAGGAVQSLSDPSAQAVLNEVKQRGLTIESLRSPLVHSGLGVTALTASGENVVVGSRSFLLQEKVSVGLADARVNALEGGGRSVVLVALATKLIGIIALQDGLRPGARAAVQKLLEARVEPVLLSGEARETCETIARALDVDHVRPEVLPQDRANEVRALGEADHLVAVIGHVDADAEALGAGEFSVAMRGGAHVGNAGAVVSSDDVRDAIFAITNAKRARRFAQTAIAVGVAPGVAAVVAIAFGAPRGFAPLAAVLSSAFVLLMARESASRSPR